MHRMVVVASLALSLAAAPAGASVAPSPGTGETQEIVQARPHLLSFAAQQAERGRGRRTDQVWLSPIIQHELAPGALELTLVFRAVLTVHRLYRELSGWLSTQPLDPSLKNPLCGATKWGLKAIAYAANIACCVGGVPACVVCTLGLDDVKDAIKGIDCSKECKPDCPIG